MNIYDKAKINGELIFSKNGKNEFRMIPISIDKHDIVHREANSLCYIVA